MLATPEIAGLPYVISGLVAAGGLAAALSTADGLLLTIANALSHDLYYKMINPNASTQKRVTISKVLLLVVAIIAAYVTSLKPGNILFLVGAAFSMAASAFFPALVLGVFWKRANKWGAIAGMVAGLGVCLYYMVHTYPTFIQWFGTTQMDQWFGIAPISAGVFGVPVGIITILVVSLLTPAPEQGSAGAGRPRALPEPARRHGRDSRPLTSCCCSPKARGSPRAFFIGGAGYNRGLVGEMAERSKAHAWKVCMGQKPIVGSNPTLSARQAELARADACKDVHAIRSFDGSACASAGVRSSSETCS